MDRDDVPEIFERLERWRESHQGRHVLFRLAWVLAGFAVLLTGLAMTVLPGPAVVVRAQAEEARELVPVPSGP